MQHKIKYWICSVAVLVGINDFVGAQNPDPYEIINHYEARLDSIHDYTADVEIEVDVDFINIPVKHAIVYFKQPDKIKFKSKEFFMLPKKGFNNQMQKILNQPYTAIYAGSEKMGDTLKNYIIKVIPMGEKPDVILATWWIDARTFLIKKVESNTRDEGTFTLQFKYGDPAIILPTEIEVGFEIKNFSLPLKFIGRSKGLDIDESKEGDTHKGKVYIRFSNYRINRNIDDSLFETRGEDQD